MIYVKDIMSRNVKTVGSDATILDAAKSMAKWKIGSLVIMEGTTPVGIITEGDVSRTVAKGLEPARTPVTIGKKPLVSTPPEERVEVAAKKMADAGIKKLPVMEDGKLVGIITQTDIVGSSFALVTSLKEMVQARYRPPDFQL